MQHLAKTLLQIGALLLPDFTVNVEKAPLSGPQVGWALVSPPLSITPAEPACGNSTLWTKRVLLSGAARWLA